MLRSLDLVKPREPFSKFDAATPALLNLFAGLMSGKSYEGGLGGALDIAGQALGSSTPLFADAIKARQEYEATDPEAGLKNIALELALQDKDKGSSKLKTSTKVYGQFGDNEDNTGFGFRDVYEDGSSVFKYGGESFQSFKGLPEPKDSDPKVFEDENYDITIGAGDEAKTYTTLGVQRDDSIFITDPRPDSETFGKRVNITTIPDLQIKKSKQAQVLSIADQLELMLQEKDIERKTQIAGDTYESIKKRAEQALEKINNYETASSVLDDATTGSFAAQRAGFVKFLETFNVDEISPTLFNTINTALQTNETVATETLNALAQKAFIKNAQDYDDRLNQTEVGKLADADFNITLSTEGSRLLIDIYKEQERIYADAGRLNQMLASDLPMGAQRAIAEFPELEEEIKAFTGKDGTLSLINSTNIVEQYVQKKLLEFGNSEEIKNRINSVLDIEGIGDQNYFLNLEDVELKNGHVFNPAKAYEDGKIRFLGYADSNGNFEFRGNPVTVGNVKKPIYEYVYEKGDKTFVTPLQF
jgi:ElaB/YqjD/DUF883 family membrane-anchored ribosome-binding protein